MQFLCFFLITSPCPVFVHGPVLGHCPGLGHVSSLGHGPKPKLVPVIPNAFDLCSLYGARCMRTGPCPWLQSFHISGPGLGPGPGPFKFLAPALVPVPSYFWSRSLHISGPSPGPFIFLVPVLVPSYFWSRPWSRS